MVIDIMLGITIMVDIMLDIEVDIKVLIMVLIKSPNCFTIIFILPNSHHLLSIYFNYNF